MRPHHGRSRSVCHFPKADVPVTLRQLRGPKSELAVPDWSLSEVGRNRLNAALRRSWWKTVERIVSSSERKAKQLCDGPRYPLSDSLAPLEPIRALTCHQQWVDVYLDLEETCLRTFPIAIRAARLARNSSDDAGFFQCLPTCGLMWLQTLHCQPFGKRIRCVRRVLTTRNSRTEASSR